MKKGHPPRFWDGWSFALEEGEITALRGRGALYRRGEGRNLPGQDQ